MNFCPPCCKGYLSPWGRNEFFFNPIRTMMKRHTRFILQFVVFAAISLYACKKNEDDHIYSLKVNYKTIGLYCYPESRIQWSFSVYVENGVPPYHYNWIRPEITSEGDTFAIDITENPVIRLEIEDAEENWGKLNLKIKKDTIDSLKYDYRNLYIGEYRGMTTAYYYDWHSMPGPEYTLYADTFFVQKAEKFSQVMINTWKLDFDYNSSTFSYLNGGYANSHLYNDTLYLYSHTGLYDSHTFIGTKIKAGDDLSD